MRLSASVFAVYWPLRLYLNIDTWEWNFLQHKQLWIIWAIEIPLTILFLASWLGFTEWVESKFLKRPRLDFHIDVKWPVQLITLLVAGALAVMFNVGFHALLRSTKAYLSDKDVKAAPLTKKDPPQLEFYKELERNRRAKGNNGLTVLAMLMAFYLSANRRGARELAQLRINAEQLKREATQTQFAALRNQINPHFLFNSLSILSSLVDVDPKLSVKFIKQLSKVYRYILEQQDAERTSLKTELTFLESYSFLLNIRFDGKFQVLNKVTPPDANRYAIAPLTLQLLVENAVKHNQMSAEHPLIISIETDHDYLLVSNPLQRRPQLEESTGVGLENITNRYRLLTDRRVSIGEEDDCFVIKLPLLS